MRNYLINTARNTTQLGMKYLLPLETENCLGLLGEINEYVLISDSQGGRWGWDRGPLTDSWKNQLTFLISLCGGFVDVWASSRLCEGGRSMSLTLWLGGWTDGCVDGWVVGRKMAVQIDG